MKYSYILHTPEKNIKIADADFAIGEKQIPLAPYTVTVKTEEKGGYLLTNVTVRTEKEADVYHQYQLVLGLYRKGLFG